MSADDRPRGLALERHLSSQRAADLCGDLLPKITVAADHRAIGEGVSGGAGQGP